MCELARARAPKKKKGEMGGRGGTDEEIDCPLRREKQT